MQRNMSETIKRVQATESDKKALAKIRINPRDIENDFFDYSTVVVKKPWGYEYLIFQNECVAVWILHMKSDSQTSMHCHPSKKTSLVVLEGEAECLTLNKQMKRPAGTGLMVGEGTFHQTKVTSKNGAFVMEVESPVNKKELIRLKDVYGRAGKGYETVDKQAFLQNYNYLTLNEPDVYYNVTKRFGQCTLALKKIKTSGELNELLRLSGDNVISILRGCLMNSNGNAVAGVGDTLTVKDLKITKNLKIKRELEILVVKRHDTVIKVSDYVISFLKTHGVKEVFFVPGDANVHLIDSIGRDEELNYICNQTERVSSIAAEAYSKLTSKLGVLLISSGASGTNAITGVASAWTDSTPLFVISGQAISDEPKSSRIRQLGNKSLNIVDVVKPITKYAVRVSDPKDIRCCLEKAAYTALEGRPGPVWIDIPIDIQGMTIDERELLRFRPDFGKIISPKLNQKISEVAELLKKSQRPVILAGNGIRLSGAQGKILKLVDRLKVPVLTSRRGADLVPDHHPLFFGRPGAYGQRRSNFIIQNSDLLISIGARLSIPQVGRNYKAFARAAKKIIVDIDEKELEKKTIRADLKINASANDFIDKLLEKIKNEKLSSHSKWIDKCRKWTKRFSPLSENLYKHKKFVNPYLFLNAFSQELGEHEIIVVDGGPVMNYTMQTFKFKKGQRMISATGIELPGFALPGSIGACIGHDRKQVLCLCEDRGFQINLQELQTIRDNKLPIKIFILKSKGHSNIRKIQHDYFGGRYVGTDDETLFGSPALLKIARIYGFEIFKISKPKKLRMQIRRVLKLKGPVVCEVQVDKNQELIPRIVLNVSREGAWEARPLEDMYPFLGRETLKENMLVDT